MIRSPIGATDSRRWILGFWLVAPLLLVLLSASAAEAKPRAPEGRTYLIYVIGLGSTQFEAEADCLTFDTETACTPGEQTCFDWRRAGGGVQTAQQVGIEITAEIESEGVVISFDGQGRIDDRGGKSSIAVSARAQAQGAQLNFSFAGRQYSRSKCQRLLEDLP